MKMPKNQPGEAASERFPRSLAADEMRPDELAAEQATELPGREAMSVIAIGDNVAAPTNEATAINFDSDYSVAVADADQVVIVDQTDLDPDTTEEQTLTRGNGRGGNR